MAIAFLRFAILLCLFLSVPIAFGQRQRQQAVLRGVSSTAVVVERLSPDALDGGLTVDQVQTDVELRLRRAGVRVDEKAGSFVYVSITVLKVSPSDSYAVYVSVQFNRPASIEIPKQLPLVEGVNVWDEGLLSIVGAKRFRDETRQDVADLCDKFLNDYLAANPRR